MPRTIRESSNLPALLLASGGLAVGYVLVHDAVDRRLLTAESIFGSTFTVLMAALGVTMAGIILWDLFASRWKR